MSKVIKGTKDQKAQMRVVKGQADTRQMRCKCGNLAVQVPDGKGGHVYACSCGKRFQFTQI